GGFHAHPARPERPRPRGGGRLLREAVRRRAEQAQARLRELRARSAAAEAGAVRGARRARAPEPPGGGARRRLPGRRGDRSPPGRRHRRRDRGGSDLLLRASGQGLVQRSAGRALGVLSRASRRRELRRAGRAGRADGARRRERQRLLRLRARTSRCCETLRFDIRSPAHDPGGRRMLRSLSSAVALLVLVAAAPAVRAQDDAPGGPPPFSEGDVIGLGDIDKLRPYLPKEVWANRDFFFYEGMKLEIGPSFADYSPAPVYQEATAKFKGQPRLGPDGSLENYVAGQPFPMEEIDCEGDPDAGAKIMWNFSYRWAPISGFSSF